MAEPFVEQEKVEAKAFAIVVFAAKIITWAALLAAAIIVEFGLVRKIYEAEFGKEKPECVPVSSTRSPAPAASPPVTMPRSLAE